MVFAILTTAVLIALLPFLAYAVLLLYPPGQRFTEHGLGLLNDILIITVFIGGTLFVLSLLVAAA